jgi:hypothetical protein
MEDMRAIFMDMDSLHISGETITTDMIPLVHDETFRSLVGHLASKHRSKKTRSHYEIVVHDHLAT